MSRHGFGRGEYKYFSYPLPEILQGLRTTLYEKLAPIANNWNQEMGIDDRYPEKHADFLERCHKAGWEKRVRHRGLGASSYVLVSLNRQQIRHSNLSVSIGLTRVARRAGARQATIVVLPSTKTAATIVMESRDPT